MSAHTPGPWVFLQADDPNGETNAGRPLTISSPTNDDLANVYSSDDATVAIPRDEAIANARLIAAAPDLLAALVTLLEETEYFSPPDDPATVAAKAAIAKATQP